MENESGVGAVQALAWPEPCTVCKRYFIGIDPGKSGGIAVLGEGLHEPFACAPMPDTERAVSDFLARYRVGSIALIELVHSMPKQGVKSVGTFMAGYGGLRMCLTDFRIPFSTVLPRAWMGIYGVPKNLEKPARKKFLVACAESLFPRTKVNLKTADALLIAEFNRRRSIGALTGEKNGG